jgi:hypothetical protein
MAVIRDHEEGDQIGVGAEMNGESGGLAHQWGFCPVTKQR